MLGLEAPFCLASAKPFIAEAGISEAVAAGRAGELALPCDPKRATRGGLITRRGAEAGPECGPAGRMRVRLRRASEGRSLSVGRG